MMRTSESGHEPVVSPLLAGRVAIVTGAGRGLGRAMAVGLARAGATVIAAAHIAPDLDELTAVSAAPGRIITNLADLRERKACDRVLAAAREVGGPHILVNNAGLTMTYICPDLYVRASPPKFWEASDEIVENVIATNVLAAERLARRAAPMMVEQGWGRIINVTTMLQTMNKIGFHPYGASKAALEMASEVWSKELAGTGVTVNVLNPGGGANTPGMAEERREASRAGRTERLVEPEDMVSPLLWLASRAADDVNGIRIDARLWDPRLSPLDALRKAGRPLGLTLKPPTQQAAGDQR
jgi:NAD(P)-dependent dehydrogenase (short-subunit alcohol dehydrogenase family)